MAAVFIPFAVTAAAIPLLWGNWLGWSDVAVFALMYLLSGIGVTVGFHRMLTHRSFKTHKITQYVFAYLGMLSVQGPVIDWVADHRKHHAHTDQEGDPHSPHVGHGHGLAGLWHAHTGWLFETHGQSDWKKYAAELYEDPGMRRINKAFPWIAYLSLAIPTALGFVLHGFTLEGALRGLIWGGLVRAFFLHHVTWSINSVCHYFGRRRFAIEDHSTNEFCLATPSFGESWHHNHHVFPSSAYHGLGRQAYSQLGGVVARTLRDIEKDMLIVRDQASLSGGRFLVCVDGSSYSYKAMRSALELTGSRPVTW